MTAQAPAIPDQTVHVPSPHSTPAITGGRVPGEPCLSEGAVDAANAAETAPSPEVARLLDGDEVVLLALAPSLWFVPLACLGSLAAIACGTLGMAWLSRFPVVPWSDAQAFLLGLSLVGLRLAWQMLEWSMRLYVLTDRRALRLAGILRRRCDQTLLMDVRHTTVLAPPRERALDVGTLLFAATGSPFALTWETVRRPQQVLGTVREAVERYGV